MIKELVKLANHLDKNKLQKEADYLDGIIKKICQDQIQTYNRKEPVKIKAVPLRGAKEIGREAADDISNIVKEILDEKKHIITTTSSNTDADEFYDKILIKIHFENEKEAMEINAEIFDKLYKAVSEYSKDNEYILDENVEIYTQGSMIIIAVSAENHVVANF